TSIRNLMDPNGDLVTDFNDVYIRKHFNVADPSTVATLDLDMRFSDGVAIYLNGTFVAGANGPAAPVWNSLANAVRPDAFAQLSQNFSLTNFRNLLVSGDNVISIQGMNRDASGNN